MSRIGGTPSAPQNNLRRRYQAVRERQQARDCRRSAQHCSEGASAEGLEPSMHLPSQPFGMASHLSVSPMNQLTSPRQQIRRPQTFISNAEEGRASRTSSRPPTSPCAEIYRLEKAQGCKAQVTQASRRSVAEREAVTRHRQN